MRVAVSEFKNNCTKILREIATQHKIVEITNRGKVVAIITPANPEPELAPRTFLGSLQGTVTFLPGWDEPLGETDWEACR